ncbi:MAG: CaiB/BaiF CoA transferase family protein [Dehalococcoidia bacterium]
MPTQALADLKVLDLTHYIAGPYCTKLMADFGAEVIKVERPGRGDGARHIGPFYKDSPHPEKSGLFLYLNTNKRSLTLNLKSRQGVSTFKELVKRADLVVENFRPAVMPSLGLTYEALDELNPRLVMTSISNFGQTGPYRDYKADEMVPYALSGLMYSSGLADRPPIKIGANMIQYQAGSMAALHSLIALHAAEVRGRGEHVDVSIAEVQAGSIDRGGPMLLSYQYTGQSTQRGYQQRHGGDFVRRCKDGYLNITPYVEFVPRALRMIGRSDLLEDPRFATPEAQAQQENVEIFDSMFEPWLLEHTVEEVWMAAQRERLLSGPVNTSKQLAADPNFSARGYWPEVERAHVGKLAYPGRPFVLTDAPWSLKRPAPTLGEHNLEIYCGLLGYSRGNLVKLRESGII